jgi:preprotein translocase subunit SecA
MHHADIAIPGLFWGDYPERRPATRRFVDRVDESLRAWTVRLCDALPSWQRQQDNGLLQAVRSVVMPSDTAAAVQACRELLLREGLSSKALTQTLGLVVQVAEQQLGLSAFDAQLIAARAVLQNNLTEMATGEGKTLAVALAAAVAALAGMPVHVVTANDYLVARDAANLAPLYTALGLRVGTVVQTDAAPARAQAYACDITYVSAKELVFDYLRDSLGTSRKRSDAVGALHALPDASTTPPLLRGLCMAIVDEADAVLIDEARVPLILSQATAAAASAAHTHQALRLARALRAGDDFCLDPANLTATLTDSGRERALRLCSDMPVDADNGAWRHVQHREHALCMALVALHGLQRDRHYLLLDVQGQRRVQLIDSSSGRIAQGRAWSGGLQQLVEAKEGCTLSAPLTTLAQLTFQRFFARYVRLGGLSGTLCEARGELMAHYGKTVRRVPLRRPSRRRVWPLRLFADDAQLWSAVAHEVARLHQQQRPVLVATDSVQQAEKLSKVLIARALPHAVLHARHDAEEAQLVARAGQRGAITVTTNMAGRGTDIELGDGVAQLGGLHVISCQLNAARRIDRQLAGRAARQGDPGSVQTLLSLHNPLLVQAYPRAVRAAWARCAPALPSWLQRGLVRVPQWGEEQKQRLQRQRLMAQDERTERQLAFGATFE